MKVCIINNIYPPYHRGGAEQVVVTTVEGLLADGHDVLIITATPDAETVECHDRLTIYRLHPQNIFFYTDADRFSFFARAIWHGVDMFHVPVARRVENILQKEAPQLVHTHNLMGLSFLIPGIVRRLGLRHVHTVHDVQLVEPSAMILKEREASWRYTGWPAKFYGAVMRRLIGSPDVVISPSQFLLDFYRARNFFPDSEQVIVRNPVPFSTQETAMMVKEPHRCCRFLYIGQIERHKGVLLLLEAFRTLQQECPSVELHIVGSGSLLEEVRRQTADAVGVFVYGRLKREELPSLFATMDVTVVPSLCYENSPTVIFESLSFGLPVLASDIEGVAELIREGENGLTFETGNARMLADRMQWCVTHESAVEKMSSQTRHSLVGLSRNEYIDRLLTLYSPA